MRQGKSRSCGCLKDESARARCSNPDTHPATRHGHAKNYTGTESSEYRAWRAAKHRCCSPKNRYWKDYGGRGIEMAPEWQESFEAFLAYIGPRPSPAHSIDRFPDNDGHYEPGNVRWATAKEQASNRRPKPRKAQA